MELGLEFPLLSYVVIKHDIIQPHCLVMIILAIPVAIVTLGLHRSRTWYDQDVERGRNPRQVSQWERPSVKSYRRADALWNMGGWEGAAGKCYGAQVCQ